MDRLKFGVIVCLIVLMQFHANAQMISPQAYIEKYRDIAVREMLIYRIPASIKLAQALLESSSGNSALAVQANNHFGIKCHMGWEGDSFIQDDDSKNECFRKYLNPEESYKDHSLFLRNRPRYAALFELPPNDYRAWAYGLKAAGYATNPNYAELVIRQIELYNLNYLDTISLMPVSLAGSTNPVALTTDKKHQTHHKGQLGGSAHDKNSTQSGEVAGEISVSGREIFLNNRIKYIRAGKAETVEQICQDLDIMPWQIYKYNDLSKTDLIKPGQIIYLQPKRRKAAVKEHLVIKDESVRDISQQYGIKISRIYKLNGISSGNAITPGQKLRLR